MLTNKQKQTTLTASSSRRNTRGRTGTIRRAVPKNLELESRQDNCAIHSPNVNRRGIHTPPPTTIRMENHLRPILRDRRAARRFQTEIRRLQKWPLSSGIRTLDGAGVRIFDIIPERGEAMRREEEEIRPIGGADDIRRFDERAVRVVDVEDCRWLAYFRDAVAFQLLKHYRHGATGQTAVAAVSSAADAVAVGFVDDVEGAVGIFERGWVDCAAVFVWAGEGFVERDVGTERVGAF